MANQFLKNQLKGFMQFVRGQGIIGLAIGLVLGTAVKSVVDSIVANIVNPVLGLLLGGVDLSQRSICLKTVASECKNYLTYGKLISDIISFLTIAALIYIAIQIFKAGSSKK